VPVVLVVPPDVVLPIVEVPVVPEVVVAVVAVCIVPEVSVEVPAGIAEVLVAPVSVVDIVLDIAVSVLEVVAAVSTAAVSVLLFSVFEQAMPKVESAATVRRTRSDFFICVNPFFLASYYRWSESSGL
jgi:hypothetical protein